MQKTIQAERLSNWRLTPPQSKVLLCIGASTDFVSDGQLVHASRPPRVRGGDLRPSNFAVERTCTVVTTAPAAAGQTGDPVLQLAEVTLLTTTDSSVPGAVYSAWWLDAATRAFLGYWEPFKRFSLSPETGGGADKIRWADILTVQEVPA